MSTRSHTLRNALFSSVGLYTEYVLGMLTSIIIARHLGPGHYGTYSLMIWLVALGVALSNSGTAGAAIKFVAELRGADRLDMVPPLLAYLRRAQQVFLLAVLLAGAGVFVFAGEKMTAGMNQPLLLGFLVIAVVMRASYMFNIGVSKGYENFRDTAIIALVSTPANLAMVVLAVWFDAPVEWLLGVFVVSSAVFFLMSRWRVARMVPRAVAGAKLDAVLLARIRRHMWYTAWIVAVGFVVASEVEVLFLNLYTDAAAAGHFKVGYQLATGAALLVPGVFGALLLPMMANALSRGRAIAGRRFAASTIYLALLGAPLVAFGLIFSDAVIELLYGGAYAEAAPVFAICLAAVGVVTATQGGSSLLISADRQGSVLLVSAACGVLKIGLDVFLISRYGLNGAVIAFVTVSLLGAVAMMVLAIRVSQVMPDWARLLRVVLAAALGGLAAWPLHGRLPPLAAILAGTFTLSVVYGIATLLLGCWSRSDVEHLQQLYQRLGAGRPRVGARLLAWAHHRASAGAA